MTATTVAAEMLTRMTREAAITKAAYISHMHRSHAGCSAFWASIATILAASNDVGVSAAGDEDVFSFSDAVKARMKMRA